MFAVRKAVVTRQLRPGNKFPSVRALSQELNVDPHTVHKVVAALVAEGVLVTTPAVGSIVAGREVGGKRSGRSCSVWKSNGLWWRRRNSGSISTMCKRRLWLIGKNSADDEDYDERRKELTPGRRAGKAEGPVSCIT